MAKMLSILHIGPANRNSAHNVQIPAMCFAFAL
jgi:hypothetical protein